MCEEKERAVLSGAVVGVGVGGRSMLPGNTLLPCCIIYGYKTLPLLYSKG